MDVADLGDDPGLDGAQRAQQGEQTFLGIFFRLVLLLVSFFLLFPAEFALGLAEHGRRRLGLLAGARTVAFAHGILSAFLGLVRRPSKIASGFVAGGDLFGEDLGAFGQLTLLFLQTARVGTLVEVGGKAFLLGCQFPGPGGEVAGGIAAAQQVEELLHGGQRSLLIFDRLRTFGGASQVDGGLLEAFGRSLFADQLLGRGKSLGRSRKDPAFQFSHLIGEVALTGGEVALEGAGGRINRLSQV